MTEKDAMSSASGLGAETGGPQNTKTETPQQYQPPDVDPESGPSSDEESRRPSAAFDERVSNEPLPGIGKYPDGGWRAWLVVAGAACGLFTSFGWTNCESAVWYRTSHRA